MRMHVDHKQRGWWSCLLGRLPLSLLLSSSHGGFWISEELFIFIHCCSNKTCMSLFPLIPIKIKSLLCGHKSTNSIFISLQLHTLKFTQNINILHILYTFLLLFYNHFPVSNSLHTCLIYCISVGLFVNILSNFSDEKQVLIDRNYMGTFDFVICPNKC